MCRVVLRKPAAYQRSCQYTYQLDAETMSVDSKDDEHANWNNSTETLHSITLHLAAAVVVDGDRVLVIRRSKTERFLPCVWGVPCGKLDSGESPPEAALRELREETGLMGNVVRHLGTSTFSSVWRGQTARNVQINFLVHLRGSQRKIKLPKEDQAAAWLFRDDIETFDGLDEYNRDVIEQWLRLTDSDQPELASSAAIASSRRR
jgi:8-oxo-dGTP diphosphatase